MALGLGFKIIAISIFNQRKQFRWHYGLEDLAFTKTKVPNESAETAPKTLLKPH